VRTIPNPAWTAFAVLFAAFAPAGAQAPAPGLVHIRCRISVPFGVTEPLTLASQIYRVRRDDTGHYKLDGEVQSLIVSLTPGEGGTAAGKFEVDLEPGSDIEYEFKVVPLDRDGDERTDGRYSFVGPDGRGDAYDNAVTLLPAKINEIVLNLRWVKHGPNDRSNFLRVAPRPGRDDYLLTLSVGDATGINLMN